MITELPQDPFDTACWSSGPFNDARRVFGEVFSHKEIKELRREVRRIGTYAFSEKLYKKAAPCDVLLDMKVVRSALAAAHALRAASGAELAPAAEPVVVRLVDYCCGGGKPDAWGDFPRSLTIKEYHHPYGVFATLFRRESLQRWVRDWEALVEAALTPGDAGLRLNVIPLCKGLTKLLEAAHLIWVREGGGGIKSAGGGGKGASADGAPGAAVVGSAGKRKQGV